jgi:hypothetical protein
MKWINFKMSRSRMLNQHSYGLGILLYAQTLGDLPCRAATSIHLAVVGVRVEEMGYDDGDVAVGRYLEAVDLTQLVVLN